MSCDWQAEDNNYGKSLLIIIIMDIKMLMHIQVNIKI